MEWIKALRQSIDYMEQHLLDDIDASDVAKSVNISPFYYQRGFQIVTGYSVKEYLRSRRLYLAGLDMLKCRDKVIDLAYRYGYETPESFTKAFTRFHGIAPSQLKRDVSRIKTFLPLKISIIVQGGNAMNYDIETMDEIQVIGFSRRFSTLDSYEKIPLFWEEYVENLSKQNYTTEVLEILKRCHVGEFGICIDDATEDDTFRYIIAGRYDGSNIPDDMDIYTIPANTWAKFKCVGSMPMALQIINTRIFKEWLPENPCYEIAGSYNIEWYSCGDTKSMEYESGIWIPIREIK